MATTAEVPEDDEAWLYGEPEKKKDGAKIEGEITSTLSADAPPFKPSKGVDGSMENDDKEAGEVNSEEGDENDNENENPDEDDDSDDDDDVQVTIGDIKTQATTYEKFKSGYTRSGQANKSSTKGVDLETPGTINDQSVYEYDLSTLNVDERAWRKPGADITDYFNYGFTEETWMKYCEKQKWLRNDNGVGGKLFSHGSHMTSSRRDPAPPRSIERIDRSDRSESKPTEVSSPSVGSNSYNRLPPTSLSTPASTTSTSIIAVTTPAVDGRLAGPPPGRKMSGAIDVIGGTRNDSRRPMDHYDYGNNDNTHTHTTDYHTPTDLPPPHIPPPGYGAPPPMVPPPGGVPPHLAGPPIGVPPPGAPPRFSPSGPPQHNFYTPPTGPPPTDGRGPPPGYDNRGTYGNFDAGYGAPPPGYGAPPPAQPAWDNRGAPFNEWDYSRRSPPRSDSEFSRQGRSHSSRREGRERSAERSDDHRERRHRDRSERDRSERASSIDREKEERHRSRSSRKEGSEGAEHRSKHKKSKRSKRDRDDEPMDTTGEAEDSAQ